MNREWCFIVEARERDLGKIFLKEAVVMADGKGH